MSHGRPGHTDVVVVAECQEFLASELCPIVGDDGVWNPEPMDDVSEEQHRLLGFDSIDRTSLDPFGELIDCYQQMGVASGGLLQRPNHVEPPHGERPCNGDGLEGLGREVHLPRIVLASLAGAYELGGVSNSRWLVEPLAEGISDKRPRCCMVPVGSRMQVPK